MGKNTGPGRYLGCMGILFRDINLLRISQADILDGDLKVDVNVSRSGHGHNV